MSRLQLENLNIEGLREVARQFDVDIRGSRNALFDRLSDHFEKYGWPEQITLAGPSGSEERHGPSETLASGDTGRDGRAITLNPSAYADPPLNEGQQTAQPCEQSPSAINIQEIVQAVVQVMESRRINQTEPNGENGQLSRTMSGASNGAQSTASHSWNQIKFTAKLIPIFAGKDDENVVKWVERCTSVARQYQIANEVLVLAAVNQLTGRALEWYTRQSVDAVATWEDFQAHLRSYFERKESITTILSRVGRRMWKAHSEKFTDYVEDKLKLMQFLTLSEKEQIELLADGVREPNLRRFVLDIRSTSIPEFVNRVRRITEDGPIRQREGGDVRPLQRRPSMGSEKTCTHCKRAGHAVEECRTAKRICFNCGKQGHVSTYCPTGASADRVNHLEQAKRRRQLHRTSRQRRTSTSSSEGLHLWS